MTPRTRASVRWGVVGALTFLVLVQGYDLFVGLDVGFAPRFAVAALVGAAVTALSYGLTPRFGSKGRT